MLYQFSSSSELSARHFLTRIINNKNANSCEIKDRTDQLVGKGIVQPVSAKTSLCGRGFQRYTSSRA